MIFFRPAHSDLAGSEKQAPSISVPSEVCIPTSNDLVHTELIKIQSQLILEIFKFRIFPDHVIVDVFAGI